MKKIFITLFVIGIAAFIFAWYSNNNEEIVNTGLKSYRNTTLGISFKYPDYLSLSANKDDVALSHDIPFRNTGGCDMAGEEIIYDRLTDLYISFRTFNTGLVETMRTVSPYIPEENFVNNKVVESPGFIDTYSIGEWSGYAIYEGAEGCGQTVYYFPISNNRTLLVSKASIQALSGIRSAEAEAEVLAVPGVISKEKYMEIFEEIMKTVEVN